MFKTFSAAALSVTIALAAIAPTPAMAADEEDFARFLLGAGLLAVLAKAIDEGRDDDHDRHHRPAPAVKPAPKVVHKHVYKPAPQTVITPARPHVTGKQPAKTVKAARAIPSRCERTVQTRNGTRRYLQRSCLMSSGVQVSNLPRQCKAQLEVPGKDFVGWNRWCLEQKGYRIR